MKLNVIIASIVIMLFGMEIVHSAQSYSFYARQGDLALQFGIVGVNDLSLKNVNSGIGLQYYIANNIAIRGQFAMNVKNENLDKAQATDFQNYSLNMSGFSACPGLRFNIVAVNSVLLYSGMEGTYSYVYSKEVGKSFKDISSTTKTNEFGAGAFLGVEWFIYKNISVSGEYKLNARWSNSTNILESSTQYIETKAPNAFNFNLGNSSGQLVISFYF